MFWIGLAVGAVVGGCVGVFVMALCIVSHNSDIDNCK